MQLRTTDRVVRWLFAGLQNQAESAEVIQPGMRAKPQFPLSARIRRNDLECRPSRLINCFQLQAKT
jgi:hypothetical protein